MPLTPPFKPEYIPEATLANPGSVLHLIPPLPTVQQILSQGTYNEESVWFRLARDWLNHGGDNLKLRGKFGMNQPKALTHIATIMRGEGLSDDEKTVACAWLLDNWFQEDADMYWSKKETA